MPIVLGYPNVGVLFLLCLLGFVEHWGLVADHLLTLLIVAAPNVLFLYRLNFGAMSFCDGVLLWVGGRLHLFCLLSLEYLVAHPDAVRLDVSPLIFVLLNDILLLCVPLPWVLDVRPVVHPVARG